MITADSLSLEGEALPIAEGFSLYHPLTFSKKRLVRPNEIRSTESLLVPIFQNGTLVYEIPPLEELRLRRQNDLERLDPGIRRLVNPHIYHVSLTEKLWDLKNELIRRTIPD